MVSTRACRWRSVLKGLPTSSPISLSPRSLQKKKVVYDRVGNGISFQKIPRNRLGTASVIPHMKVLILRQNSQNNLFSSAKCFGTNSESLRLFLFHGTELWVVFSSAEWFRTEFWEFSSIFFTVQNSELFSLPRKSRPEFPRVFCSAEQPEFRQNKPNVPSIFFRLPRNNFLLEIANHRQIFSI